MGVWSTFHIDDVVWLVCATVRHMVACAFLLLFVWVQGRQDIQRDQGACICHATPPGNNNVNTTHESNNINT